MRCRHRFLAPVLVLGGVVSATGGATIVDMPPPPTHAARSGDEVQEPSESAPAKTPGEVALDRYAGGRRTPAYTSMPSPAPWAWGRPYGRYGYGHGYGYGYGYGYGAYPYWSPGWYGWGFRSPFFGHSRFRRPHFGFRRHGTSLSFHGRRR